MYSVSTVFRLIQYRREGKQLNFHIRAISLTSVGKPPCFFLHFLPCLHMALSYQTVPKTLTHCRISVGTSIFSKKSDREQRSSFVSRSNYIILDGSARTITLGFLRMDYLQWKTQMPSENFSRNFLAENINRWKYITADGLFRNNGTTTIWIWKHWNNSMVNNC